MQAIQIINPIENTEKHRLATNRYEVIETNKVLEVFHDHGLEVARERISGWINPDNNGKQVHLLELRRVGEVAKVGLASPRIFFLNSHNRRRAMTIDVGLYRYWCDNGCASPVSVSQPLKINHLVGAAEALDKAIPLMLARFDGLLAWANRMEQAQVSKLDEYMLARQVLTLVRGGRPVNSFDFTEAQRPLRAQDDGRSLWQIYNKYQEKALNGGLIYHIDSTRRDENGIRRAVERRMTTRRVKEPARRFDLNKSIVELFDRHLVNA